MSVNFQLFGVLKVCVCESCESPQASCEFANSPRSLGPHFFGHTVSFSVSTTQQPVCYHDKQVCVFEFLLIGHELCRYNDPMKTEQKFSCFVVCLIHSLCVLNPSNPFYPLIFTLFVYLFSLDSFFSAVSPILLSSESKLYLGSLYKLP